jgi:hypothetical protein
MIVGALVAAVAASYLLSGKPWLVVVTTAVTGIAVFSIDTAIITPRNMRVKSEKVRKGGQVMRASGTGSIVAGRSIQINGDGIEIGEAPADADMANGDTGRNREPS